MENSSALFNVLMVEVAFKDELLETHVFGDHRVDVECVEENQDNQQHWEDDVVGLSEYWNNIGFTHHSNERCVSIVDYLQKVVP